MAPLARYRRLEARHAVGRAPLVGLAAGALLLVVTQLLTPLLPEAVITFLEQAFHIRGLGAVVLLNDYLAVYTVTYFVGVSQLLRVVVAPREERQLDLLLTKPIPPATFLAARIQPVLLSTGALGLALSVGCALAMAPFVAPGADGSALGALGAGLLVTALTVLLLAIANLVLLGLTDGFQALLAAFVVWVVPLLPTSVFLYRPDLFEGREALATALVGPANLIWHDGGMVVAAAVAVIVTGLATTGLVRAAGWRVARMDLH